MLTIGFRHTTSSGLQARAPTTGCGRFGGWCILGAKHPQGRWHLVQLDSGSDVTVGFSEFGSLNSRRGSRHISRIVTDSPSLTYQDQISSTFGQRIGASVLARALT